MYRSESGVLKPRPALSLNQGTALPLYHIQNILYTRGYIILGLAHVTHIQFTVYICVSSKVNLLTQIQFPLKKKAFISDVTSHS